MRKVKTIFFLEGFGLPFYQLESGEILAPMVFNNNITIYYNREESIVETAKIKSMSPDEKAAFVNLINKTFDQAEVALTPF